MGEYADYFLNGDDCQVCGMHIGSGGGFPRTCRGCGGGFEEWKETKKPKTPEQRHKNTLKRRRNRNNRRLRKLQQTESIAGQGAGFSHNIPPPSASEILTNQEK